MRERGSARADRLNLSTIELEGLQMHNLAYACLEYKPFFICETAPQERYEPRLRRCNRTEDELGAIRIVLQKLAALRILNSNDAEDLVQDTLLTMIVKYPETNVEKGLLVWSMGILRKKVGNYYRKVQRYASLNMQEASDQEWTHHTMLVASPEVKVRYEELRTLVETIVAGFPPLQRRAMELLLTGLGAGEIAGQLQPARYQNVINHLHRGRRRLGKELAKYGYGLRSKAGGRFRKIQDANK